MIRKIKPNMFKIIHNLIHLKRLIIKKGLYKIKYNILTIINFYVLENKIQVL